jgi:hypothetical protein
MGDMEILFPERDVKIGGVTITVTPLTFGRLPKASRLIAPVLKALNESGVLSLQGMIIEIAGGIVELIGAGGDDLIAFLAFVIDRPVEWFETLAVDDGIELVKAVYEVNADFFAQRLRPMIPSQADGGKLSESSSEPVTEEQT